LERLDADVTVGLLSKIILTEEGMGKWAEFVK